MRFSLPALPCLFLALAGADGVTLRSLSGKAALECNAAGEVLAVEWDGQRLPGQGGGWYLLDEQEAPPPREKPFLPGGNGWRTDASVLWDGKPALCWEGQASLPPSLEGTILTVPEAVYRLEGAVRVEAEGEISLRAEVQEEGEEGEPMGPPVRSLIPLGPTWQPFSLSWTAHPQGRRARWSLRFPPGPKRIWLAPPRLREHLPPPRHWWSQGVAAGEASGAWRVQDGGALWQGEWPRRGLRLQVRWEPLEQGWRIQVAIRPLQPGPRGWRVGFCLPWEVSGWAWWHDLQRRTLLEGTSSWAGDWGRWGEEGWGSLWPLACLTRGPLGVAWGLSLSLPASFRLMARSGEGLSWEWDLACAEGENPQWLLEAFLLRCEGRWGLRSAWQEWASLQPEAFRRRLEVEGAWLSGLWPEAVPEPLMWGLRFDELPGPWAEWEQAKGLLPFGFLSPFGLWALPQGPSLKEEAVRQGRAKPEVLEGPLSPARFSLEPWEGNYWPLNPFAEPWAEAVQSAWRKVIASLGGVALPELGGERRGWQSGVGPNTVWPQRSVPWAWSRLEGAPRQWAGWLFWDFLRQQPREGWRMGHLEPGPFLPWLASLLDVLVGAPTSMPLAEWGQWLRLAAGSKPLSLEMEELLDPQVPLVQVEDRLQICLLWALFPGDGPWVDAQRAMVLQPLLSRYALWLAYLAHLGWQPLPLAEVEPEGVRVERYGSPPEVAWVLWNPRFQTVTARLRLEADGLQGWGALLPLRSLTEERWLYALRRASGVWEVSLPLKAREAKVLRWREGEGFGEP